MRKSFEGKQITLRSNTWKDVKFCIDSISNNMKYVERDLKNGDIYYARLLMYTRIYPAIYEAKNRVKLIRNLI